VRNNPVNFADPRGLISHLVAEAIVEFFEFLIAPSFHTTEEDEWMANYWAERERELIEERISESGLEEYLEVAEALNQRLDAIISIYENEISNRGCPPSKR
jgi:hypothetical protein